MRGTHLTALLAGLVFTWWLMTGRVAATVGGLTVTVPALAVAATVLVAVTAAAVWLVIYRTRAERAMLAAAKPVNFCALCGSMYTGTSHACHRATSGGMP
jgi:hypothetical protein